jgi:hypothetical protein
MTKVWAIPLAPEAPSEASAGSQIPMGVAKSPFYRSLIANEFDRPDLAMVHADVNLARNSI